MELSFTGPQGCGNGACVEVAVDGDQVYVRDGKNAGGPVLAFTEQEWTTFCAAVTAGQFTTTQAAG